MFGLGSRVRARVGTIRCPRCKSSRMRKDGFDRNRNQMFECAKCGKKTSVRHFSPFKGMRTNEHAVIFGLKLYLMGLSLRQTGYALGETGTSISHVSVRNWILRFGHRCRQLLYRRRIESGDTWYVDEMHEKRNGKKYCTCSVKDGKSQVIALWISTHRDSASATDLFKKAVRIAGKTPEMIRVRETVHIVRRSSAGDRRYHSGRLHNSRGFPRNPRIGYLRYLLPVVFLTRLNSTQSSSRSRGARRR